MKTLTTVLIAILITTSSWNTKTTPLPVDKKTVVTTNTGENFSFFRTHRQGKGITSTWGLISNEGITGFVVQQTYEDPTDPYAYWSDLASIPCTDDRSFKYTDKNVFPGFISYRIVAMSGTSVVDVTEISTVHIIQH
jgi:hypothetical protein